jgi:aminomethyltransferase
MVEFAGWEMPMKFSSIAEEHMAVREAAGLFDVSHMGEFMIRGPAALDFLQKVTTNNVSMLAVGGAQYSTVVNERGGTLDDVVIYRLGEQEFMLVCNASNVEKIWNWFVRHAGKADLKDMTMTTVLLAIQGPKAQKILQRLTDFDLNQVKRFHGVWAEVSGLKVWVSRSGYTGEDGFELFLVNVPQSSPEDAEKLWGAIVDAGEKDGLKPCGLGSRDTTRLEAGLCLYGNELTEEISPLEAKIGFVVKLDKGDFVGKEALLRQKEAGLKRVRVGLRMLEAGIPRSGYGIFRGEEKIGFVTSGTFSPLLKIGAAMGLVVSPFKVGDKVSVEIHGSKRNAEIVNWPLYDATKYGYSRSSSV